MEDSKLYEGRRGPATLANGRQDGLRPLPRRRGGLKLADTMETTHTMQSLGILDPPPIFRQRPPHHHYRLRLNSPLSFGRNDRKA